MQIANCLHCYKNLVFDTTVGRCKGALNEVLFQIQKIVVSLAYVIFLFKTESFQTWNVLVHQLGVGNLLKPNLGCIHSAACISGTYAWIFIICNSEKKNHWHCALHTKNKSGGLCCLVNFAILCHVVFIIVLIPLRTPTDWQVRNLETAHQMELDTSCRKYLMGSYHPIEKNTDSIARFHHSPPTETLKDTKKIMKIHSQDLL